jgi:hypothetical protein
MERQRHPGQTAAGVQRCARIGAVKLELSSLPVEHRRTIQQELVPLRSLEQVVRWAFGRTPPSEIADVVVQDEFTHDVVVPWRDVHLVFDTT